MGYNHNYATGCTFSCKQGGVVAQLLIENVVEWMLAIVSFLCRAAHTSHHFPKQIHTNPLVSWSCQSSYKKSRHDLDKNDQAGCSAQTCAASFSMWRSNKSQRHIATSVSHIIRAHHNSCCFETSVFQPSTPVSVANHVTFFRVSPTAWDHCVCKYILQSGAPDAMLVGL